ncbi:putative ABC multidrug transporter [Geopyxis carbonaria]|nr:putative ABC multidrug transporter [Geopyxis carbonaria]
MSSKETNAPSIASNSETATIAGSDSHDHGYADISTGQNHTEAFESHELLDLAHTLSHRSSILLPSESNVSPEAKLRRFLLQADEDGNAVRAPEASVCFKDLVVRGHGAGATFQQSVASIVTGPMDAVKALISGAKEPEKTILHGIDGVVKGGEMLLVLGRPGSGCSTLLKNLAGLDEGYTGTSGDIKYNGLPVQEVKKRFRGDVVYNPEVDVHFPHLNVGQTLSFAAETRTPRQRVGNHSRERYIELVRDVLATTFGLSHTLNTKVGDDFVRGVSGGERKRVSIAEMLATRASVAYWDNSTRGLDSSTSLEFAQALRTATNVARNVSVVAIYQAGENLTKVFDKVTVLYLGHQIFFGTLAHANEYFQSIGYVRGSRQTTADFLTAVTDPAGREVREGWESRAPRTPEEFSKTWRESSYYRLLQAEMGAYEEKYGGGEIGLKRFEDLHRSNQAERTRQKSPYTLSVPMQISATMKRAYQRIWGDKAYLGSTAFASVVMSLITGSIFANLPADTGSFFSKGGVMFFAVLFNALGTMSEVVTQYAQRPIVQKQKSYAMYHPFTEALATMFADWPIKFINTLIFDVVLYFITGLKKEAGAFFIFFIFTYIATLTMSAIFRSIAASTKKVETAMSLSGVMILALVVYTGYVIPKPSLHPWFKWINYINPLSYAFEGLMANEFHGARYTCAALIPGIAGANIRNQVCAVTGAKPGDLFVSGDDYLALSFDYHHSNLWRNFGIIIAFWLFFVTVYAVASEVNSPAPPQGEYLIFRRNNESKHVEQAIATGASADPEKGRSTGLEVSAQRTKTTGGNIVRSKDIFTWQDVCYDIVLPNGEPRRLLDHIQGFVKPGTLTALMGESGAGKTTLLNVLAQRVDTGVVSGDILVNGSSLDRSFQRRTGYVQQQDLHLETTTVREALRFSAELRQPKEVSLQEKHDYVETVIQMLEMEEYASAIIGVPGEGLNVEQRKRCTIGVELVAKPALLLFLDEPTSGLDSQSAWSIVSFLRKLASNGQAILCTIHQPSAVLFEQFDRLLLLKKGGKTVYFGDIGDNSSTMINYFQSNGGGKCSDDDNPAEYILNVIGAGATATAELAWDEIWKNSPERAHTTQEIIDLQTEYSAKASSEPDVAVQGTFAMPWISQYFAVQKRLFQHYWRSPQYIFAKLILNVFAGLFLGFTFYKENNSAAGLQNKMFSVFMAVVLSGSLMNQLQPVFYSLSDLYAVREKPSKLYHWTTFVLGNIVVEIPFNFVTGTMFFLPWYYAIGFWQAYDDQASRGAYMWFMYMLFQLFFSTFAQAIASFTPNEQTAAIVNTLLFSFILSFNGVLQPLSKLVGFWHWMYRVSPFTYLIAGLLSNVLHDVPIVCSTHEINVFQPPSGQTCMEYAGEFVKMSQMGQLLNPNDTADCGYCRFSVGDEFLATVNMFNSEKWRNAGLLFVYVAFNALVVFGGFYFTRVSTGSIKNLFKKKAKKA